MRFGDRLDNANQQGVSGAFASRLFIDNRLEMVR